MNIKGRWIHKTVDNYNFFFFPLFFFGFFFLFSLFPFFFPNGKKRLRRPLITVSYQAVTEIKLQACSVLRKEREWKGEEEKREGDQNGLDASRKGGAMLFMNIHSQSHL